MTAPTTSQQAVLQVIEILHFNGIQVANTKASYEQLKQYEADPNFAMVLATLFNSSAPVGGSIATQPGAVDWLHYRRLAGITLKNNVERAKTLLGEPAVIAVAQSSIQELRLATHASLVSIAAQIAVKITSIVGLSWWDTASICNLPSFLLSELLAAPSETAVLGGLYCLQYLLEDVPKQLGAASEVIVQQVAQMVMDENRPETIRRAAFRVASHPYELGSLLDWNVEALSPMQQGLCNASRSFARCCTSLLAASQHITFASLVLRSATLMFDYLEYFFDNDAESMHLAATWVGAALQHVLHPANPDVATAAADFFAYLFEVYERTGGEGPILVLATAATQAFPSLIPALFKYIALTQEEEQAILEKDHYSHRDAYAVVLQVSSSSAGGRLEDHAEDDGMDDDEGTLRKSAASCLDKLCTIAPNEASALVLAEIGATWTHADWRVREASLLGFGSAVRGCFASMATHLPTIVGNLKAIIGDQSAHVCVVSMAMWCVQRIVTWLISAEGQPLVADLVDGIVARLESDSKRVQAGAVTALKVMLQAITEVQLQLPAALIEGAVRRIHRCIELRYNTGNLSSLCDVSLIFLGLLPDSMVTAFATPFFGVRAAKMTSFEQSYHAAFVEHQHNAMVDKDVMYLDRVLVAVLERSPSAEQQTSILSTWAGVLWDIAQRSAYDDADLVFHSIFNASQYVRSFDTTSLTTWLAHRDYDIVKATLQILEHHTPANSFIRCSCYVMLYQLINVALDSCLRDAWTLETCYRCATTMLTNDVDDDPALLSAISNLLGLLITLRPEQRSLDAVLLLSQKLRGDAFGESYAHHFAVSCSLSKVARAHPTIAAQLPLTVVATIFAAAPNSLSKSLATIDLCTAIQAALATSDPSVINAIAQSVPSLLRMVFSWQQASAAFGNGTFEAIGGFLRSLLQHGQLSAAAQQVLQGLPDGYRAQFLQTYGLA